MTSRTVGPPPIRATTLAGLSVALCLCASAAPEPPPPGATHVLDRATVVDVRSGELHAGRSIWLGGRRILRVGAGEVSPPDGVEHVDLKGAYVIPGLWDMHVHWYDERYLPLFIANGVTGVRQMFGSPVHHEWRRRVEAGELLGPRQVIASRIVDGPQPVWPASITAATPEEGRAAVARALDEDADFTKVYSLLPKEAYLAIADEAKRLGVHFAGHVPGRSSLLEAAAAGQRSVEHLTGVLWASSGDQDHLQQLVERGELPWWKKTPLIESYSADLAARTFERLSEHDLWMCPTLTVLRSGGYADDPSLRRDPRLRYLPPSLRDRWAAPPRWSEDAATYYAEGRAGFAKSLELVGELHRAGVPILAGTDVLNPYCIPGFSLHDELALLVEAGLTPLDALRAATLTAAEFLERENELGTVETGRVADLVVLAKNPLADIRHTTSIVGVVAAGRWLDRITLDTLLSQVEAIASPAEPDED